MANAHRFFRCCLISLAWICLCINTSFGQNPKITKIVSQGDPTPLGGSFNFPSFLNNFSINDYEDYVFGAQIEGGTASEAIFLTFGAKTSAIIAMGDSLPGIGKYQLYVNSSINNDGTVAFDGLIPINGLLYKYGLFMSNGQGISKIIMTGDSLPGGGVSQSPIIIPNSLNDAGIVAFRDWTNRAGSQQGIFLSSGSIISKAVVTGDATPIGGTFRGNLQFLDFNDAGTVLFSSFDAISGSKSGIFTSKGGSISKIIAKGEPSPGGEPLPGKYTFTTFDNFASINNAGDVVFGASVCDSNTFACYNGLYLFSGGAISLLAMQYVEVAGIGRYTSFGSFSINDSKQIAFTAAFTVANKLYEGVLAIIDGSVRRIAVEGDPTPLGGTYSDIGSLPKITAGGSIAFKAPVEGGSSSFGVFIWNGAPRLSVSKDVVEFTDIIPGQTAKLEMEISNTGGKLLEVQEITATPNPPFGLEDVPALPLSLEPGQKTQFLVTYSPPPAAAYNTGLSKASGILQDGSGTLSLKSNAPHPNTTIQLRAPGIRSVWPDGVAYDPLNPAPEDGRPSHSKFTDLIISGTDLAKVTEVTFKPLDNIEVTRVKATGLLVEFDMIVHHTAVLGERDLLLLTPDGADPDTAPDTINVSAILKKKFIITRINTEFNQAVNQALVKTLLYKNKVVSDKLGVLRVRFDDSNQSGKIFNGRVEVSGVGSLVNPFIHIPQDNYTEADVIAGRDYLTMPIPQPLSAGKRDFKFVLNRVSDGMVIWGPVINREIIESVEFSVLGVSYRIRKDGTTLEPIADAEAQRALELLRLIYPISRNKLRYQHIGTRDLPVTIETKEVLLSPAGARTTVLTNQGRANLFLDLSKKLERANNQALKNNKPGFNLLIVFLPSNILFEDKDNDGSVDWRPVGLTSRNYRVCLVAAQNPARLQGVTVHEVGHAIGTVLNPNQNTNNVNNLGDEYQGGHFYCNVNQPVQGLIGHDNVSCPNSPYVNGIHGDVKGTYTDRTAYNPLAMKPMLTYLGSQKTIKIHNFMSSSMPIDSIWVQPGVYDRLLQNLLPLAGTEQNLSAGLNTLAVKAIRLKGNIFDNGAVEFDDFDLITTGDRTLQLGGPYSFELQDASGSMLASHSFDLDFIELSEPPQISDRDFFNIIMNYPDGTKKVVLKKNGAEIASRTVSDHAPVVQIISPQGGGNFSGNVEISWAASDPDGDSLRYTILYTPDGELWLPVESNITRTSYTWNSDQFPGGNSAKIAVIASDGVNSGEAETSIGFSIDQKRPTVSFTNPKNDSTFDGSSPIIFTASGYDLEDGTLPDSAFSFSSSIDGQLGRGSPSYVSKLSLGIHTITVRASDRDGNIATDAIRLAVSTTGVDESDHPIPITFALFQNYPNPFNPTTSIRFEIPVVTPVSLRIYNILGQEVRTLADQRYALGRYEMVWDGRNNLGMPVTSGVYFIRLVAGEFVKVIKMAVIR